MRGVMLLSMVLVATTGVVFGKANAAVYKCKDAAGNITFSGQPCSTNAEVITVKTHTPRPEDVAKAQKDIESMGKDLATAKKERDIAELRRQIEVKENEMSSALSYLKSQQSTARNNLAGAQYYSGLATEMQAVTTRYQGEIEVLRKQIEAKKQE